MLDKKNYAEIVKKHAGLVRSISVANGLTGDDFDDALEDLWVDMLKSRAEARRLENNVPAKEAKG